MKTIKMLFAALGATALLAACTSTMNNQQENADTTYMESTPPPNDTMMHDTMMHDTL